MAFILSLYSVQSKLVLKESIYVMRKAIFAAVYQAGERVFANTLFFYPTLELG
jgi:hypothetical protein